MTFIKMLIDEGVIDIPIHATNYRKAILEALSGDDHFLKDAVKSLQPYIDKLASVKLRSDIWEKMKRGQLGALILCTEVVLWFYYLCQAAKSESSHVKTIKNS